MLSRHFGKETVNYFSCNYMALNASLQSPIRGQIPVLFN